MLLEKLPRLPLGTVMDTSGGKLKQTIVDQVDSMETTLAHLFPEMTANITAPVLTLIFLFVLDWRLALLSLVVFPIAFFFMMMVMGGYAKDFAGAVQATNEMSGAMIEYINGIEVIKAFNQGKNLTHDWQTRCVPTPNITTTGCAAASWVCPWPTPSSLLKC